MNSTRHNQCPCPMSPTMLESSDPEPLSPDPIMDDFSEMTTHSSPPDLITDSSSNMSTSPSPLETYFRNHPSPVSPNSACLRDDETMLSTSSETLEPTFQPLEPPIYTYVVSLLHALPFLFRIRPLPTGWNEKAPPPLDPLEPVGISRELDRMSLHGMIRIPLLINPIQLQRHRTTICAALRALPISIPIINMALTLISTIHPSHFGWNHPARFHTYHITPTHPIPASRSISLTEDCCYSQFSDGVIIKKRNEHCVYQDKSYIPALVSNEQYGQDNYPYGWTAGIDKFCRSQGHHPDCINPIRRAFIEREFVVHTINDVEQFDVLDDYLCTIQHNAAGCNLQWLQSASVPILDNIPKRAVLTELYRQIALQGGRALHTRKGLRITIPEERWSGYSTYSPDSKGKFMRVAWAQLTQFDKEALMTSLKDGKLDNRTIYLDFDDEAKHNRFWETELASVRQYFIELVSQTGAFYHYNPAVYQELAYHNAPLELPFRPSWDSGTRPMHVILPYSRLSLIWNPTLRRWAYENQEWNDVGIYSPRSLNRFNLASLSVPSLIDPIDDFEKEDRLQSS